MPTLSAKDRQEGSRNLLLTCTWEEGTIPTLQGSGIGRTSVLELASMKANGMLEKQTCFDQV